MKICMFSGLFRNRSIDEAFAIGSRLGYEAIEIRCKSPHIDENTGLDDLKHIHDLTNRYNMPIAAIYASFYGNFSQIDDQECLKQYNSIKKFIDMMEVLDTEMLTIGCGGPNAFLARKENFERSALWIRKCADYAALFNKKITLEIHNQSLAETADSALRLLELIDRSNVGLIHDAGNMYITDTDYGLDAITKLGDKIFHVHIKDITRATDKALPDAFENVTKYGNEIFRLMQLNKGQTDHIKVIKALKQRQFKGCLSCECNVSIDDFKNAEYEICELKKLLSEL